MVMKWTVAKTPMVWFRRFKGRVSINKSMNGSFSILLTTVVAKSQMLLRSLHSKSFRYCKSKYFSHFHSFFFKHGWSIFLNPFTSKLAPQKNRSSSFSQTISIFFPLDFNRGGTIPQQPSDASNHPRGVKNKMRSCDVKVFRVVFKFFGCEDRTDEVVSEMFGLFTLILGGDPIYFSDGWLNHQVEDRDRQFSAALQIVWVKLVFSRAFFAEIIDLFLQWHWFCDCYDALVKQDSTLVLGRGKVCPFLRVLRHDYFPWVFWGFCWFAYSIRSTNLWSSPMDSESNSLVQPRCRVGKVSGGTDGSKLVKDGGWYSRHITMW